MNYQIFHNLKYIQTLRSPQRPYKNLNEFCFRHMYYGTTLKINQYPCLVCQGRGWIYDPKSRPDPNEGNRNRDTVDCQFCNRTGLGNRSDCVEEYNRVINKWKTERNFFESNLALFKSIIAKLTEEEITALVEILVPKTFSQYSSNNDKMKKIVI